MYASDGQHASEAGSMVAAYVIASVYLGKAPEMKENVYFNISSEELYRSIKI
jgi:hypothetical protein